MDFGAIPTGALYAAAGLIAGFFGRLIFKKRDAILDLAIEAAQRALRSNLAPDGEKAKAMARDAVIEEVIHFLRSRGFNSGVENAARLALEIALRKLKKG